MSQLNAIEPVPTPYMDAKLRGEVQNLFPEHIDEKDFGAALIRYGWRNVRNQLKVHLHSLSMPNDPNNIPPMGPQEAEKWNELLEVCLKYAKLDNDRKRLEHSFYNALVWEDTEEKFVFQCTPVKGTKESKPQEFGKALKEEGMLTQNARQESVVRKLNEKLFDPEPSLEDRMKIIQFTYFLKMTRDDAERYLTKWAFSDSFRWDSPWELAAEYTIEKHGKEHDSLKSFNEKIRDITNGKAPKEYAPFVARKEQQEYDRWVDLCQQAWHGSRQDAFLCHWAWLLLIERKGITRKNYIPSFSRSALALSLPPIFKELCEYVQKFVLATEAGQMREEDLKLKAQLIDLMKKRNLRMLAAAYEYARGIKPKDPIELSYQGHSVYYFPPQLSQGFRELDLPALFISRYNSSKSDPEKALKRYTRSDIIALGLKLALTEKGINQLLTIGGFFPLYSRDFFEYALLQTLYENEQRMGSDGFRFCATQENEIRAVCSLDMKTAREQMRADIIEHLSANYQCIYPNEPCGTPSSMPRWVKAMLQEDTCLSSGKEKHHE